MRCGVLYDKQGNIKATWALVSDNQIMSIDQPDDEIIEWETDHGEREPHHERKAQKIERAIAEQDRIKVMSHRDEAVTHNWERARLVKVRRHDSVE